MAVNEDQEKKSLRLWRKWIGGHFHPSGYVCVGQGVTKRCRPSWLTNSALVYEPEWGGGGCEVSANDCSWAHGAQVNFGDLTPYLPIASMQLTFTTSVSATDMNTSQLCLRIRPQVMSDQCCHFPTLLEGCCGVRSITDEIVHRLAMAIFLRTFSHDGIFCPAWCGWGVACPLDSSKTIERILPVLSLIVSLESSGSLEYIVVTSNQNLSSSPTGVLLLRLYMFLIF
jgi:hypothetical protein